MIDVPAEPVLVDELQGESKEAGKKPEQEEQKELPPPSTSKGVEVEFIGEGGKPVTKVFSRRPFGMKFGNRRSKDSAEKTPIFVSFVSAGSHAAELGIKEGWTFTKIDGQPCTDITLDQAQQLFKDRANILPEYP